LTFYLDTSVLVPYYSPEALSQPSEALISSQLRPAISDLCGVELFSALARKLRLGEVDLSDAERIKTRFQSHVESSYYTLLAIERHHLRLAQDWIGRFKSRLRTLDGLHLAIAAINGATLATADLALAHSAQVFGVDVLLVS
jgi:uncharacterized protein